METAEKYSNSREKLEISREPIIEVTKPRIITKLLPESEYFHSIQAKKQLTIHHTVSSNIPFAWWKYDKRRIATCNSIDRDGDIYQMFRDERNWAQHLGVPSKFLLKKRFPDFMSRNAYLNKISIGIELVCWGGLIMCEGSWRVPTWNKMLKKFVVHPNIRPIPDNEVYLYPQGYRGFVGFQKYTDAQIQSLEELLAYYAEKYEIPLDYMPDMWDVKNGALNGSPGIYSHTSYREDKSDCHPQRELFDMLYKLKNKYWHVNKNK